MTRLKIAMQHLQDKINHMFRHADEERLTRWEQVFLCSAAPISAEAMREDQPHHQ